MKSLSRGAPSPSPRRNPILIAVLAILLIVALTLILKTGSNTSGGVALRTPHVLRSECTPNTTRVPAKWFEVTPGPHPNPSAVRATDWQSQDDEDWFAWFNYFYGRSGLTVLESGALDGSLFSTSAGLVRSLGWRAIHLEPGLSNYRGLIGNRPESANFHVALCASERTLHTTNVGFAADGIVELMNEDTLGYFQPELFKALKANPNFIRTLPEIRCAPLHIILAPLCVSHIDLWILDVEGAELDVLQGVDFERIEIDVISAEAADNSPVKNALVIKLLESKGFVHEGYLGRNDWFRRAGFVPHRGHGLVSLNVTSRGQAPLPARLAPDWAAYWLFDKVVYHRNDPWQVQMRSDMPPLA